MKLIFLLVILISTVAVHPLMAEHRNNLDQVKPPAGVTLPPDAQMGTGNEKILKPEKVQPVTPPTLGTAPRSGGSEKTAVGYTKKQDNVADVGEAQAPPDQASTKPAIPPKKAIQATKADKNCPGAKFELMPGKDGKFKVKTSKGKLFDVTETDPQPGFDLGVDPMKGRKAKEVLGVQSAKQAGMRAFSFTEDPASIDDFGEPPENSSYYIVTSADIETQLQNFDVRAAKPQVILATPIGGAAIGAAVGGALGGVAGSILMCLNGGGGGGGGGEAQPPVGQGKGGGQGQGKK